MTDSTHADHTRADSDSNSVNMSDHYGELSRTPCPVPGCNGERVRKQSTKLPLGCTEMTCTGDCGAYEDYEGNRQAGNSLRLKYDLDDHHPINAHPCPTKGCDEQVPTSGEYDVEDFHDVPDDIVRLECHMACAECGVEFTIGITADGDRELL